MSALNFFRRLRPDLAALCPLPRPTIRLIFAQVETRFPTVRKRIWYAAALLLVVLAGLASRRYPALLPATLGKYPGDALWALMVFIGWGMVFPARSTLRILIYTLVTSYGVEFGKLYRAPWLNDVRDSTIGHLILGSTFSWQNLAAYTIGAVVGAVVERVLIRKYCTARPTPW